MSFMARCGVIPASKPADPAAWSAALTRAQEESRAIARAHSRFIADHLGSGQQGTGLAAVGRAALAEYRPMVAEWRRKEGGHPRTVETYSRLAAGWATRARHEAKLLGQRPDRRVSYGLDILRGMFVAQAERAGKSPGARSMTDQAELFIRKASEVLATGTSYVADAELKGEGRYRPPAGLPPEMYPRLGWRPDRDGGWEPVTPGPPIGAAIIYDDQAEVKGGRRPHYDWRLLVAPVDLDKLTATAGTRASRDRVPLILSGGAVLRGKLVAASVLQHKDAVGQRTEVWGESGTHRYVLDLRKLIDGTLGHTNDEARGGPPAHQCGCLAHQIAAQSYALRHGLPAPPASAGDDVPELIAADTSASEPTSAPSADSGLKYTGGARHPCVVCGKPTDFIDAAGDSCCAACYDPADTERRRQAALDAATADAASADGGPAEGKPAEDAPAPTITGVGSCSRCGSPYIKTAEYGNLCDLCQRGGEGEGGSDDTSGGGNNDDDDDDGDGTSEPGGPESDEDSASPATGGLNAQITRAYRAPERRLAHGKQYAPRDKRVASLVSYLQKKVPEWRDVSWEEASAALDVIESVLPIEWPTKWSMTGIKVLLALETRPKSGPGGKGIRFPAENTEPIVYALDRCTDFNTVWPEALDDPGGVGWVVWCDMRRAYLNAMRDVEVGTGKPEMIASPSLRRLQCSPKGGLSLAYWPGYLQFDPRVALGPPFTNVKPGQYIPTQLAKLVQMRAELGLCDMPPVTSALLWPEKWTWLRPAADVIWDADVALSVRDDLPARIAHAVIKRTYKQMAGMLASGTQPGQKHANRTKWLRPEARHGVEGQFAFHKWYGLDRGTPGPVLDYAIDASFFLMPRPGDMSDPGSLPQGLNFGPHRGHWRMTGTGRADEDVVAAIERGNPAYILRAVRASCHRYDQRAAGKGDA